MPSGVLLEWRAFVKKETGINIMVDDMEYLTKLLHKKQIRKKIRTSVWIRVQ